jgi:hypothetical protein
LGLKDLPRSRGKGRFGLLIATDLPRSRGKGRFGLLIATDLPRSRGKGRFGLLIATDLPRSRGKGRFGLPIATDLPRSRGKGRFGLPIATDLPRSRGKGRFGLLIATDLPRSRGKGKFGLPTDTFALAKHGTTRTAEKAATDSSFMERASQGSLLLVAYRLRIPNLSGGCLGLLQLWWNLALERMVILPTYFVSHFAPGSVVIYFDPNRVKESHALLRLRPQQRLWLLSSWDGPSPRRALIVAP